MSGLTRALALNLAVLVCSFASAEGAELRELYRGTRATGMGGAFVAVADDEQAIFMNPAGMAGQKRLGIQYMILDLEASTDVVSSALEAQEAFQNLNGDSLNLIMGKNIFGHAQATPSITMPNLGIALLFDEQVALLAKNRALPQITLGYQQTHGIQVAWGTSLSGRRGARSGDDFRIGVAGKMMWRRGGYKLLSLTQVLNANESIISEVAGSFERSYGFDAGIQYIKAVNSRLDLNFGVAMTDIAGMNFGGLSDPQESNLSAGLAVVYRLPRITTTLAYDYRHILQDADWTMKNHLGAEVSLPFLNIYTGLYQTFLTYGFSFDAWMFRLSAVSYAEEQGLYTTQDMERRYLLQLAFKI